MQLALHGRGVQAVEYGAALQAMLEADLLKKSTAGSFILLTEAGFARL